MNRNTYNKLYKIAFELDPTRPGSAENIATAAGIVFNSMPKNTRSVRLSKIFAAPRNRVLSPGFKHKKFVGPESYSAAARDFYNEYDDGGRLLFAEMKKGKDGKLTIDRSKLRNHFGSAWIDNPGTMCNAAVAHIAQRATARPIFTDDETGYTYHVAKLNKMLSSDKPTDINGYRFTPITWEDAMNTHGALVLDPEHMGMRMQRGDGTWGTINASWRNGLAISDYGDPASPLTRHKEKTRYFRFEPIPKNPPAVTGGIQK